jgi:hypothetical protein
LAGKNRSAGDGKNFTEPLVHRSTGEVADFVVNPDECISTYDPRPGPERIPPLSKRTGIKGVNAAEGVSFHKVALVVRDPSHLVLTDQRVAAH